MNVNATITKASISIRAATNADGDKIGELAWASGFTIEGIDWSCVEPNWIVAQCDGDVVGAVQICVGKPFGRMELLCIDQRLTHKIKAIVVRELLYMGCRMLKQMGSQIVTGLVDDTRENFMRVLDRRGVRKLSTGAIYMLKVRP